MQKKFKSFYKAWWFIFEHPKFMDEYGFSVIHEIDIDVVKVNPATESIDDDKSKNTETRVWLEWGPHVWWDGKDGPNAGWVNSHDTRLDCGGNTFEQAIIALAEKVYDYYGS